MNRGKDSPVGLYAVAIALLFLIGFFLLVVFGSQNYRNTIGSQSGNMHERSLLSYLATTVKAYDARGAVWLEEADRGQILHIADGDTGYALRIYLHDGCLVEDYAAADAPLSPDAAQVIGECTDFRALWLAEDLLRIETDAGPVLLHLRSEGGAA